MTLSHSPIISLGKNLGKMRNDRGWRGQGGRAEEGWRKKKSEKSEGNSLTDGKEGGILCGTP